MPDEDPQQLLDRAHTMRAEALRAMDLAQQAVRPEVRGGLRTLAANWLSRAQELERRALSLGQAAKPDDPH